MLTSFSHNPEDMEEFVPERMNHQCADKAPQPCSPRQWRPHSAGEAAWFDDLFCSVCTRDQAFRAGTDDSCPIAADGFGVAIGLEPPPQWIEDARGPRCTEFQPTGGSNA